METSLPMVLLLFCMLWAKYELLFGGFSALLCSAKFVKLECVNHWIYESDKANNPHYRLWLSGVPLKRASRRL